MSFFTISCSSSVTEASPTLYQLDMDPDGTSLNAFSTDLMAADK